MKAELMNRDEEAPMVPAQELLGHALAMDASDLHVTVGAKPTVRVHGDLRPLDQYEILEPDQVRVAGDRVPLVRAGAGEPVGCPRAAFPANPATCPDS